MVLVLNICIYTNVCTYVYMCVHVDKGKEVLEQDLNKKYRCVVYLIKRKSK